MRVFLRLVARFGQIGVLVGFVFTALLILTDHFGVAERVANYILILAITVVTFRLFKGKQYRISYSREKFSDRFLVLGSLGIVVAALLVFRAIFLPGPAVWGDAPYFFPEGLRELVAEPYAWVNRGYNFGGVNGFLWLYPLMLLYGALHVFLGLEHDVIIRVLFYFPSVVLSFIGPVVLVRYWGYSRVVQFFAGFFYGLNTYFLLLVDGGQIGVVMGYGLFPVAFLFLHKLVLRPNISHFFPSLFVYLFLVIADVRLAAINFLSFVLWMMIERLNKGREVFRDLRIFLPFGISLLFLGSYFVVPTLRLLSSLVDSGISDSQLVSLLNPLLLFQPHWPLNEFGKVSPPPFYFAGIPILLFSSLLVRRERRILVFAFCVLFFAFLTKGTAPPLGEFYSIVVDNISLGVILRDSTKFFVPLILFSGILIGLSIEGLSIIPKRKVLRISVLTLGVGYLLFLVYPALMGKLNGVLSWDRKFPDVYKVVQSKLAGDEGFFRTAWFPERHPFSFHTEGKPSLDAKELVDLHPFASMNVGIFDRFNFLYNEQFIDWFNLLGVRYLVFSGDWRKNELNIEERQSWNVLLDLLGSLKKLEKVDWETEFSIFKVPSIKPRIFMVDKLIVVVGGDDVYQRLRTVDNNFSVGNQGFVFVEDGNVDFTGLDGIKPDSLLLLFNKGKSGLDLTMSFLQEYFVSPRDSVNSEWAIRSTEDYLRWKYEFLTNNIEISEFDYGKGIAFSSRVGEEIKFGFNVERAGKYILAIRGLSMGEKPVNFSFSDIEGEIDDFGSNTFTWHFQPEIYLSEGVYSLVIRNEDGFGVVNTVVLIPQKDWDLAMGKQEDFITRFESVALNNDALDLGKLKHIVSLGSWSEVEYEQINPARYRVNLPSGPQWIVFSDRYNTGWQLKRDYHISPSQPFYSAINGFYRLYDWDRSEIVFAPQDDVRWGLYYSVLAVLILAIIFCWFYARRKT